MPKDPQKRTYSGQLQRLLPSKLFRQKPAEWHIVRNKVLQKLSSDRMRRLTILQAPAGYGKSTFLSQWADSLNRDGLRVAWLVLDSSDREPMTFLSYLLAAIEARGQPGDAIEQKFSRSRGEAAIERLTAYLVSRAFDIDADVVVMLDDYHLVDSPEISRIVDRLIRTMPASFHFVVATRETPLIHTSVLRGRDDLMHAGMDELRFTLDETKAFLDDRLASQLNNDQVQRLWEVTDGWPVAIQTAHLWLRDSQASMSSIDRFSGRIKDIADYLNEQVMDSLPEDIQDFLLKTSVLDRFSGDIANYVCDRIDSWEIIDQLVRRNLFLINEDDEGRWYRYHHLFGEFLRDRLDRVKPRIATKLTSRAASWYADNDHFGEAIRAYTTSGDYDAAAKLIGESGGWRLIYRAQTSVLREFFDSIDEVFVQRWPRLYLAYICVKIKSGQMEVAEHHLQQWDSAAFNQDNDLLLAADRLFVGTLWSDYREGPSTDSDVQELRDTLVAVDHGDNLLKSMLYSQLCNSCFELCRLDEAREAAQIAKQYLEADGIDYETYPLDISLGQIMLCRGDLSRAGDVFQAICKAMQEELGDDSDAICIARIMLASTRFEQNRLADAEKHLDDALWHAEQFDGWYSVYAAGYEALAGIAYIENGLDGALNVWQRAQEVGEKRDLWKLNLHAKYRRILLYQRAGEQQSASTLSARLESEIEERRLADRAIAQAVQIRHLRSEVAIRLAIASGQGACARDLIRPLLSEVIDLDWRSRNVKLLILDAQSWFIENNRERGFISIENALLLIPSDPQIQSFLEEGENFLRNLRDAVASPGVLSSRSREIAKVILSGNANTTNIDKASVYQDGYSRRELETLHLIGDGLSGKEIAFELGISENTVRFHRKNLYRKLNAHSRATVLAAARQLGLI